MPDFRQFQTTYNDYLDNPGDYSLDDVAKLAKQAQQFGVRFDPVDPGFSAVRTLKTFGTGLLSGFTTLPTGGNPTNEVEGIAHSLGHLIGFIGGIPALGPFKGAQIGMMAAKGVMKGGAIGSRIATKTATKEAIESAAITTASATGKWMGKSLPMAGADYILGKVGKTAITNTLKDYVTNDIARQMIRHGAHLGTASMISGWSDAAQEESIYEGMKSVMLQGVTGAGFGAGFGAIGNIKIPGIKTMTTMDKTIKALAGATFQGVPGVIQGATTPENFYNFLLGAYFGSRAKPALIEKAAKFVQPLTGTQALAVETNKDFLKMPKEQQEAVILFRDFHRKPLQTQAAMEHLVKVLDPEGKLV